MNQPIELVPPLSDQDVERLRAGDRVFINGTIYSARDSAHKRLVELIERGESLPFPLQGQIIYYLGPSPAPPGKVIGAAGPTTGYRMDPYTPQLLAQGLKAMIGKGKRSKEVIEAMTKYKAVYMAAIGGAGALISKCIKEVRVAAYEDLGPEAIRELRVEGLPTIVVIDSQGNNLYEEGRKRYSRED